MLTAVHLCICVFAVYAQYYSCYWASWPLCNSAPPPDALLPKHSLHFQFIPIVFFSDLSFPRKGFQGMKYSVLKSSSNSQDDVTFCSDWMLSQRVCQVWDFPPKGIFARQNEPLPLMALFLKSLCRLQRFRNHRGPLNLHITNKQIYTIEWKTAWSKVVISKNEIIWIANLSENRKIATRSQVVISKNVWIATLRAFWGNLNCSGRLFSEPDLSPFELTSKQSFSIY